MSDYIQTTLGQYSEASIDIYTITGTIGLDDGTTTDGGYDVRFSMCDSEFSIAGAEPTTIKRNEITRGGDSGSQFEVEITLNTLAAKWFIEYMPSYRLSLMVRTISLSAINPIDPATTDLSGSAITWVGTIRGNKIVGNQLTLMCEPITSSLKKPALRKHWQYQCPYAMYGKHDCMVDPESLAVPVAYVSSVSGAHTFTFDQGLGNASRINGANITNLVGGYLRYTCDLGEGEVTMMTNILQIRTSGTGTVTFYTDSPVPSVPLNNAKVYIGCQHTLAYCRDVVGNAPNYGGAPWIPLQNPIGANQFI